MAPEFEIRPAEGPFGVWNESDRAVTVRLTGASGTVFYDLPAQDTRVLVVPEAIGDVSILEVLDGDCRSTSTSRWSLNGSFEDGGQLRILQGRGSGATSRLPPEWDLALEPGSLCDGAT